MPREDESGSSAGTKRVRAYLGGELVADTIRPLLVWEVPVLPDLLPPGGRRRAPSWCRPATAATRPAGATPSTSPCGSVAPGADAALRYPDSPIEDLRDHVRLEWAAMDAWFEEDEEVFTHVRDPVHPDRHPASSRQSG